MSAPRIIDPAGGGTVTGTGTPGTLAKFTGTGTSIGDSGISDDGATVSFVARDLASTASSTTWTLGNPNSFALIVKSNSGPQRTLVLDTLSRAVGVGGAPGTLLHVQDNAGYPFAGSTYEGVRLQRSSEAIFSASDYTLSFRAGLTGATAVVGTSTAHDLLLQRGNVTALTLGASGAVTFAGNLTSSSAQTWTLASSSTSALNIQSGLLNLDTTNSRVGIGTASPSAQLHISRAGGTSNAEFMRLTNTTVATNSACGITFFQNNAAVPVNRIEGTITAAGSYDLVSYAWNGVSTAEVTRLQGSTGNVGIGTASPTKKLDVNGAANVTGALTVAGSVSRISGSTAGVLNGAFIVVAVPEVAKAFLLTSTTTNNKQLSSLHLVGSDAATAGVAALYTFQTTVAINGAGSVKITNTSGSTVTIEWSFLQIS